MKILFFLLVIFAGSISLQAKKQDDTKSYFGGIGYAYCSCILHIHASGDYVIALENLAGNTYTPMPKFHITCISWGEITINGNELTFIDRGTKCEMKAIKRDDGKIRFASGLKFLVESEPLRPVDDQDISDQDISVLKKDGALDYSQAMQVRQKYIDGNAGKIYKNTAGIYECSNNFGIKITLDPNGAYKLGALDYVISEGTWIQDCCQIVLTDGITRCDFYMLIIDDQTLQSMLVPGDYQCKGAIFSKLQDLSHPYKTKMHKKVNAE